MPHECPLDHTPNTETIEALQDASESRNLADYDSLEDFLKSTLEDDEDDKD